MTRTYWWDAPAGRLSIRQYNRGRWRLWAGEDFIGSFETAEDALRGLAAATANLDDWQVVERRLPPEM